jgi:hypothetical protein
MPFKLLMNPFKLRISDHRQPLFDIGHEARGMLETAQPAQASAWSHDHVSTQKPFDEPGVTDFPHRRSRRVLSSCERELGLRGQGILHKSQRPFRAPSDLPGWVADAGLFGSQPQSPCRLDVSSGAECDRIAVIGHFMGHATDVLLHLPCDRGILMGGQPGWEYRHAYNRSGARHGRKMFRVLPPN